MSQGKVRRKVVMLIGYDIYVTLRAYRALYVEACSEKDYYKAQDAFRLAAGLMSSKRGPRARKLPVFLRMIDGEYEPMLQQIDAWLKSLAAERPGLPSGTSPPSAPPTTSGPSGS